MKYQRKPYHSEKHNDFIVQLDHDGQWLADETPCRVLSVNGGGEVRWEFFYEDEGMSDENIEVSRYFCLTARKGKALYDRIDEGSIFEHKGERMLVSEKFDSPGGTGTGWNIVLQVHRKNRWYDYCRANTVKELKLIATAIAEATSNLGGNTNA